MEMPHRGKKKLRTISRFREVLPQALAISAANCTVMNMAITFFISTLIIDDLHNSKAELSMDDNQASWFGGLPYLCQPIGSIGSGFLVAWLGRKKSLMLICIPYLLSCVLMSTVPSLSLLFFTNVIIGITVGFTEAPINSYFGEICQPELRSMWQAVPIPDSPIWLIAQGRVKDAEAALCWLRGWVDSSEVQQELSELVKYHETTTIKSLPSNNAFICEEVIAIHTSNFEEYPAKMNLIEHDDKQLKMNGPETNETIDDNEAISSRKQSVIISDTELLPKMKNSISNVRSYGSSKDSNKSSKFMKTLKLLLEPETRRPLTLTLLLFTFSGMGGIFSIKPFLVEVLRKFQSPLDANWSSVIVAAAGFLGSVFLIAVVRVLGKRKLGLLVTATCALSCLLLGCYAFFVIKPFHETEDESFVVITWAPLTLFIVLAFASTVQGQLPWLLVAEAFPFRTRGIASGLAAAFMYFVAFVASKTYLATEESFELHGTFWFFGVINCLCVLYLYFELPETEGKSLHEIELLFAGKKGSC